jgi:hypothetical protein
MTKSRVTQFFFIIFFLVNCSSNKSLTLDECGKDGNFCYKNINFGKTRGKKYEKGIIDGCTTGEGKFTKNYYLSSSSKDYFDGWILGRSRCRQILPNEGTKQEEENSRKRAEYQIVKLKLEQKQSSVEEESIINKIFQTDSSESVEEEILPAEDVEY